eukprot:NODE_1322_length_1586_cov_25.304489_g1187_i0.p1 GENE.NODE_1322_length_1586_cov_25.304489_g1187_i0~~NODE_1322_length_1586_cov_25.304489_g1187_i0.p1  ORF type:complete len:474 (+),score=53.05 NODE_1322_length_1586_cov_25.304489_g1187_i0:88-1509(+)
MLVPTSAHTDDAAERYQQDRQRRLLTLAQLSSTLRQREEEYAHALADSRRRDTRVARFFRERRGDTLDSSGLGVSPSPLRPPPPPPSRHFVPFTVAQPWPDPIAQSLGQQWSSALALQQSQQQAEAQQKVLALQQEVFVARAERDQARAEHEESAVVRPCIAEHPEAFLPPCTPRRYAQEISLPAKIPAFVEPPQYRGDPLPPLGCHTYSRFILLLFMIVSGCCLSRIALRRDLLSACLRSELMPEDSDGFFDCIARSPTINVPGEVLVEIMQNCSTTLFEAHRARCQVYATQYSDFTSVWTILPYALCLPLIAMVLILTLVHDLPLLRGRYVPPFLHWGKFFSCVVRPLGCISSLYHTAQPLVSAVVLFRRYGTFASLPSLLANLAPHAAFIVCFWALLLGLLRDAFRRRAVRTLFILRASFIVGVGPSLGAPDKGGRFMDKGMFWGGATAIWLAAAIVVPYFLPLHIIEHL